MHLELEDLGGGFGALDRPDHRTDFVLLSHDDPGYAAEFGEADLCLVLRVVAVGLERARASVDNALDVLGEGERELVAVLDAHTHGFLLIRGDCWRRLARELEHHRSRSIGVIASHLISDHEFHVSRAQALSR